LALGKSLQRWAIESCRRAQAQEEGTHTKNKTKKKK